MNGLKSICLLYLTIIECLENKRIITEFKCRNVHKRLSESAA